LGTHMILFSKSYIAIDGLALTITLTDDGIKGHKGRDPHQILFRNDLSCINDMNALI